MSYFSSSPLCPSFFHCTSYKKTVLFDIAIQILWTLFTYLYRLISLYISLLYVVGICLLICLHPSKKFLYTLIMSPFLLELSFRYYLLFPTLHWPLTSVHTFYIVFPLLSLNIFHNYFNISTKHSNTYPGPCLIRQFIFSLVDRSLSLPSFQVL